MGFPFRDQPTALTAFSATGGQPCFGRPGTTHCAPSCSCRPAECVSFTRFTAAIAIFTATLDHQGMMLTSLTRDAERSWLEPKFRASSRRARFSPTQSLTKVHMAAALALFTYDSFSSGLGLDQHFHVLVYKTTQQNFVNVLLEVSSLKYPLAVQLHCGGSLRVMSQRFISLPSCILEGLTPHRSGN